MRLDISEAKGVATVNKNKDVIVLGIETSCDETSIAIVRNGCEVLANVISSQVPLHQKYGGVVPEIASRHHLEFILPSLQEAFTQAGLSLNNIDAIAVAAGPGLVGALLVGLSLAKSISYASKIPLVSTHHIEGHIYANFLAHKDLEPPVLCLVVSGGHTEIVLVSQHGKYELLGRTRDDAAGEAFDKVARVMGLGYPGGPLIDKLAREGNPQAIDFPRVFIKEENFDFSFSGLKTAVINYIHRAAQKNEMINQVDLAASFQAAVVDVLVQKTVRAAKHTGVKKVALAGGVAANSNLREMLKASIEKSGMELYYPPLVFCTDNAAMIACAGYYRFLRGEFADLSLNAQPNLSLF